jgi:hypothetical protein
MAAPVVMADPEAWTVGYGLGLQLWRSGEHVLVGHTGSMPGYLAVLVAHRATGTALVVLTNTYSLPGWTVARLGGSIMEAILTGQPAAPPPVWRPGPPPPDDLAPLCGRWWWMGREVEATWDADRSELMIIGVSSGSLVGRFSADGPDRWRGTAGDNIGEILTVVRDGDTVTALDIATFVFTRDPLPPG